MQCKQLNLSFYLISMPVFYRNHLNALKSFNVLAFMKRGAHCVRRILLTLNQFYLLFGSVTLLSTLILLQKKDRSLVVSQGAVWFWWCVCMCINLTVISIDYQACSNGVIGNLFLDIQNQNPVLKACCGSNCEEFQR